MTPRPLTGADAHLYDFLAQVVAIGKRRGTWTAADVHRVAAEHLAPKKPVVKPQPVIEPATQKQTVELPARQAAILQGICAGDTDVAIGHRLGISVNTVRTHNKRLYQTLGVRSRAQAAALATQLTVRSTHS